MERGRIKAETEEGGRWKIERGKRKMEREKGYLEKIKEDGKRKKEGG